MSKLRIQGLARRFGDFTAVESFSLDVAPGEFISLLGPSGCGKTTMLRMIAGFIEPTAGTIEMSGALISSPGASLAPENRRMSMIFQSYAIWPNMTVAENVAFGLELRRLGTAEIRTRVQEMLGLVRLSELADRYPAELSGGQQQRVALARAIVIQPEVLLLDEPLSNLDANLRDEMRLEIRRLHDRFGMTTIYVTHDQAEAMVTSDRIVVMNKGRVEQIDSPFRLYNAPRTRFVASFIGRTNFLRGRPSNDRVEFDGFALPSNQLPQGEGGRVSGLFSIRPQSIDIRRQQPPEGHDGRTWVPSTIQHTGYFGDRWDYTVALSATTSVIASTEPRAQFQVGEAIWVGIDPSQMAPITDDPA